MWRRYLRLLGPSVEADVDDELRFHLEMRTEELVRRGMAPEAARAEALRRLGDLQRVRSECRDIGERAHRAARWRERLATLGQEVRRAARGLRRSPGFSAVAVATLALGIAATTAIFTLLNAVVLRPLPYPQADRLAWLESPVPGVGPNDAWGISAAGYFHFREHARALESVGAWSASTLNLSDDRGAARVEAALATASLFDVLRARPALGRLFTAAEDAPNGPPVAVLSHELWTRAYGASPAVIGSTLHLNARPYEVVGVMAPGVRLPHQAVDVWRPLGLDPAAPAQNAHWLNVVARLRDGATLPQAQAELAGLTARFPERFPEAYSASFMRETGFTTRVMPLRDQVVGDAARVLWILLASVGLVLAIACVNVANLFLVRTEARRRELAIRSALGAGRGHLAWHYLTESLLLAALAAAAGVALAYAGLRLLVRLAPEGLPRVAEVALGGESVAFAAGVALAAGLVFGLFPLARGREGYGVLREGGRGLSPSRRQGRVRGALVVGQVALALVLLAAAGVMLRSFQRLRAVEPGLDPAGVLALDLSLPAATYEGYADVNRFYRTFMERVAALPGVTAVGAGTDVPLRGFGGCAVVFVEGDPPAPGEQPPCVKTQLVTPGWFRALGMSVRGPGVPPADDEKGAPGVVVTRALAERLWPGQDPIGRGIRAGGWGQPFYRVAGVVDGLRAQGLDQPETEAVFFPTVPMEGAPLWSPPRSMSLLVKVGGSARPQELTAAIRRTLRELDPQVPLGTVATMEQVVARSMARVSFTLLLLGVAAAMALLLSAVGMYGVISYLVGQRRVEIGIRMALGARMEQVRRLVVLQSVRLAAAGVALGLLGALAATRVLRSLLFEVSPTDPVTLGIAASVLVLIAVAASYAPARRAARVDPAVTLRAE